MQPTILKANWKLSVMLLLAQGLKRCPFMGIGISIITLRRSDDRLSFIKGIPIPTRQCFPGEKRPRMTFTLRCHYNIVKYIYNTISNSTM